MQMEGTTHEESSTSQRPHYTGSKEDDREEFCLALSRWVNGKQRAHRSSVRRALNGPMMLKASPEEKKNYKKNSQPDWQGMYEELPSFLQSELAVIMRMGRWTVRDGNSLIGLTGCDGKESTMYFWALRKFVHELNKKFLMRGTKEKNGMLKAVPQTALQDGGTFVRIKLFRDRVNENLSAQFPAGKGDLEWKDLENIVRVQDKIKDEVEEWSLSIVQDLLRRQSCPYSVYELKNFGIDLNGVVTAIRAAESKKITAKEKPSEAKLPISPEGGGTREPSQKQVKYQKRMATLAEAKAGAGTARMNKQFAALPKEIKEKLAQDMGDIKSRVSSSSASVRGLSDDEEEVGVSRAAIQEEFEDDKKPLSAAQGHVHATLGSTEKMQGFTPMTPEEHQEGNPLRKAGRLDSKKSSNVLAAIDEIKTTASLALGIRGAQEDRLDEEDNLPELTDGDDSDSEDGFLDQKDYEIAEHHLRKLGESKPKAEAAFCDDKLYTRSSLAELLPSCMSALLPCCFGVVPSRNGCQDGVAGIISVEGYEELKKVTGQALDGEQRQRMNQVQPVCKLRNDLLEQGMSLISAGGELVLSPTILMDSGANCNIIPPRMVKKLSLRVVTMDVWGSHVARCDGTSAQFREYMPT
ncbi:hypothetical protein CYMTET_34998 [Cymbomonas tetramitiformis]|uniref:Uncharacterized protein n=1 Tax=Cymbomonas tetramitiformis TaxID=36881 RepID=A0AAE0KPF0_9CHLO|nr:hypothetical protein CYMTET_34998 [Cymbomonas tetramitiformis]